MKAVIVDLRGKYAAALDETGNIVKIPNADYGIGQEIELHALPSARPKANRRLAATAAAAVLALGLGTGTAFAMPYGTVTLDADSAIEYTINRFDQVLSVRALNEEGEEILSSLDGQSLRFRPVEEVIAAALDQQGTDEENPVEIRAETPSERHTERLQEHLRERIPERRPSGRPEGNPGLPADGVPQGNPDGFVPGDESRPAPFPADAGLEEPAQAMMLPEDAEVPPTGEMPAEGPPELLPESPGLSPSGEPVPPEDLPPAGNSAQGPEGRPEAPAEAPAARGGMPPPEQPAFGAPEFGAVPPAE